MTSKPVHSRHHSTSGAESLPQRVVQMPPKKRGRVLTARSYKATVGAASGRPTCGGRVNVPPHMMPVPRGGLLRVGDKGVEAVVSGEAPPCADVVLEGGPLPVLRWRVNNAAKRVSQRRKKLLRGR